MNEAFLAPSCCMGVTVTDTVAVFDRLLHHAGRCRKSLRNKALFRFSKPHNRIKQTILTSLEAGRVGNAVSLLSSFQPIDPETFLSVLQLCIRKKSAHNCKRVVSRLCSRDSQSLFLLNRVIEGLCKCGCVEDARQLFDKMPKPDGGSWNAIISGFVQSGRAQDSLFLFLRMNRIDGVKPNEVTFASALSACASMLALNLSKQIHGQVIQIGFVSNVVLGSALVDVYGKCWAMDDCWRKFKEIPEPNLVSWNVIIRRYCDVGMEEAAISLLFRMIGHGLKPLSFTFANVLSACSSNLSMTEGFQIHALAVKVGLDLDEFIMSSLIDMYAKGGHLDAARLIFDRAKSRNVISWTALVSGYAKCGQLEEARHLFDAMPQRNVVSWNAMLAGYVQLMRWDEALDLFTWLQKCTVGVDHITLRLLLNVCAGLSDLEMGRQVHAFAYRHGFHLNLFVANSVLDMYWKCGNLGTAYIWFSKMSFRDRVTWNSLISGHANNGQSEKAIQMFCKMLQEAEPNEFTFSSVLAACSNIFSLDFGKQVHAHTIRNYGDTDIVISGALVDMYSKCRCIDYALRVFLVVDSPDIILWNSIISGCAYNERGSEAIKLFESMQQKGVKADHVTFLGLLVACISGGLVDLGKQLFASMGREYYIVPRVEHYGLMIVLLSRNGCTEELEDFIDGMPFDPTPEMWNSILETHVSHGEFKVGTMGSREPS